MLAQPTKTQFLEMDTQPSALVGTREALVEQLQLFGCRWVRESGTRRPLADWAASASLDEVESLLRDCQLGLIQEEAAPAPDHCPPRGL